MVDPNILIREGQEPRHTPYAENTALSLIDMTGLARKKARGGSL